MALTKSDRKSPCSIMPYIVAWRNSSKRRVPNDIICSFAPIIIRLLRRRRLRVIILLCYSISPKWLFIRHRHRALVAASISTSNVAAIKLNALSISQNSCSISPAPRQLNIQRNYLHASTCAREAAIGMRRHRHALCYKIYANSQARCKAAWQHHALASFLTRMVAFVARY